MKKSSGYTNVSKTVISTMSSTAGRTARTPSVHRVPSAELGLAKWEIPVGDLAPAQARRWASENLRKWDAAHLFPDTATVLTELVTNAVQAGSTRMVVLIEPFDGLAELEISVWDDAPGRPHRRDPDVISEEGRGLFLVEALSTAWGHHELSIGPGRPGKVVWARLERESTR